MLDRLLYRNNWHDLVDQRLLEEGPFWDNHQRPVIDQSGNILGKLDYAADWQIKGGYVYLCGLTLTIDGSDLLARVFPGEKHPIRAAWYTGGIDATAGTKIKEDRSPYGSNVLELQRYTIFIVRDGRVVETKHGERCEQPRWTAL